MKPALSILAAVLLVSLVQPVCAADWQLVLSDRNRRVEIDRASIFASDRGTKVSWGRVVLTSEEAASAGYRTIKALNRYDCRNRSFVTVRRAYLDAAENLVREERVADQAPITVARNSVDERMWREVCDPPSAAALQKVADEALRLAAGAAPATPAGASPAAGTLPTGKGSASVGPASPPATATPSPVASASSPAQSPPRTAAPSPAVAQARAEPIRTADAAAKPVRVAAPSRDEEGARPASATRPPGPVAPVSILPPLPRIGPLAPALEAPDKAAAGGAAPERTPETRAAPELGPKLMLKTPPAPRQQAAPASTPKAGAATGAGAEPRAKPAPPPRAALAQVSAATPGGAPAATLSSPVPPPARAAQAAAAEAPAVRVTQLGHDELGWSYDGDTGPQAWGRLRPDWRLCGEGLRQSPIDLRNGVAVDLAPVRFDYRATAFRIRDTGTTLQVDVGEGMGIEVRGKRYVLERFTLHRPSQDRVGGMAYDMAIYLEHRSADGQVAILSRLLEAGGEANALLQTLWNSLPLDRGREYAPAVTIDLAALVPADPAHYLYLGSLPTPPCSEDVLWVVMKEPLPISSEQLAVFARLYPRNGRPIQPANGRLILESR
jgi:carbonic anhydrase